MSEAHSRQRMADAARRGAVTKRERTRDRLLEAAREVFTERGWSNTRMEDVARAAGVSPATLYQYFDTKFMLVKQTFSSGVEDILNEAVQNAIATGTRYDPVGALVDYFTQLSDTAISNAVLSRAHLTAKLVETSLGDIDPRPLFPYEPFKQLLLKGREIGFFKFPFNPDLMASHHTDSVLLLSTTQRSMDPRFCAEFEAYHLIDICFHG